MKNLNYFSSSFIEVEQHPAWREKMSLQDVELILAYQRPFTYILSGNGPDHYYLSYIKRNSKVVHIHFGRILFEKEGHLVKGFRNVTTLNFSSLEALIRYKIKGKGVLPDSLLLKVSA